MKRIFTVTSVLILAAALLAGCSKRDRGYAYDEDYWLSRERGVVVYSDSYCPYYVIETGRGYTVVESMSGYTPLEGSVIFGDLSRRGFMDLYNYSDDVIIRGDVVDYWLNYYDAQNMIDSYCYGAYRSDGTDAARTKKVIKKAADVERKK